MDALTLLDFLLDQQRRGVNLARVSVGFKTNRDTDVIDINFAEEGFYDADTNSKLESIVFLNEVDEEEYEFHEDNGMGMLVGDFDEDEIDLFEDYENHPPELVAVLEKFNLDEIDYLNCASLIKALEEIGYTCEYGFSAEPYNLRKL
jgi:hypothetical protein